MASKRLFIVRPTLGAGGADRVTVTLLRHLDRDRFEPELVLLRQRGELIGEVPSDVRVHDLEARNLLTGAAPLRRLIDSRQPDIVLSTSSGTNITAALAVRPGGPRLVLSERNGLVRDQPRHKLLPLLLAKRWLYSRADCVTAVSQGVADDLTRRLDLNPRRVVTVYNPVVTPDLAELAADASPDPWFEDGVPVLVAAGRLVPAKGFDLLLAAFSAIRQRTPCRLILLGEGPLRPALEARAFELGVAADFKMPGFVANPFAFMARCTAFVLSSRFEGLPGVLIQAMACGAAVVAADCPFGPAEIIDSGRDGILVPAADSEALAAAVCDLLTDPAKGRAIGREAIDSTRRFALEAVLPSYADALDPRPA